MLSLGRETRASTLVLLAAGAWATFTVDTSGHYERSFMCA